MGGGREVKEERRRVWPGEVNSQGKAGSVGVARLGHRQGGRHPSPAGQPADDSARGIVDS